MTETPIAFEFDAETLATVGWPTSPGAPTTAHPHTDRAGGGTLNYAVQFGRSTSTGSSGSARTPPSPQVARRCRPREPAYMHSFGLTERWLVLAEFPIVVNPSCSLLSRAAVHRELPLEARARHEATLIDLSTGGRRALRDRSVLRLPPLNAYEEGGSWSSTCARSPMRASSRPLPRAAPAGKPMARPRSALPDPPWCRLGRRERQLDEGFDLPRINYVRCNERPYRYAWGAGGRRVGLVRSDGQGDVPDGRRPLGRATAATGRAARRRARRRRPRTTAALLSVVLDAARPPRSCSFSTPPRLASSPAPRPRTTPVRLPRPVRGRFSVSDAERS